MNIHKSQDKESEKTGWVVRKAEKEGGYDAYADEAYQIVISALKRRGRLPVNARILDLGGGTGSFTRRLVTTGYQAVLGDISHSLVKIGNQKNGLPGVVLDGESLPFPDDSLHAVFCVDLLHHFRNPTQLLREALRVVCPGGCLFISDLNGYNPHTLLAQAHHSPVRYDYLNINESVTYPVRIRQILKGLGQEAHFEYVFLDRRKHQDIPDWRYKLYGFIFSQIKGFSKRLLAILLFNLAHWITALLPKPFRANVVLISINVQSDKNT